MRSRWWTALLGLLIGVLAAALPAAPALAHEVGGVAATNFRTTLSALVPAVAGVSLRVIENGSRLELRNDTATEVIVEGYGGEPYARVGRDGVYLNDNSPATFLNVDRFSTSTVPSTADGKGPPVWRKVADEPVWRWHDHRVHWMLSTLPPAVAADPGSPHQISAWTVTLHQGDTVLTATGTLDWVPGPSPWPWFVVLALVALGVAALALLARPHRWLAGVVAALMATSLAHGLGAMLVVAGSAAVKLSALLGADAILVWPFAAVTAWLLWRRHTRAGWLAAGLGLLLAIETVLDDAPVWWRSSAPTVFPSTVDRLMVALEVGLGVGLVLVLPVLLRRHAPGARSWNVPRPTAPATGEPGAATEPGAASAGRRGATLASLAAAGVGPVREPASGGESSASRESSGAVTVQAESSGAANVPATLPAQPGREAQPAGIGRRQVAGLLAAGAVGALVGATVVTSAEKEQAAPQTPLGDVGTRTIAFRGRHQAGIVDPYRAQAHGWVAAFDLLPGATHDGLRQLLTRWTQAAEALMAGRPLNGPDDAVVAGLGPAALTVTVGFGPSLFGKAGVPAQARPEALAPLPSFPGDALDPALCDGDLGVVVAADDPVVVAHAARVLGRLASGVAVLRWQQQGFNSARGVGSPSATPRNLMGQVDGTNNPQPSDVDFEEKVFVGPSGPRFLQGGSYLVVRRIRMLLDAWDELPVAERERFVGRRLADGAPLTGGGERTPVDLGARDGGGNLIIDPRAHIRLAAASSNEGAAMLRRSFSYVDGQQRGLLFLAWQADPRRGFIPVQQRLAGGDLLHTMLRHESSAIFAVPGGVEPGGYLGQSLLESL